MSAAPGIDEAEFWSRLRLRHVEGQKSRKLDEATRLERRRAQTKAALLRFRARQRQTSVDFDGFVSEASYPRGFACDAEALLRAYSSFWRPSTFPSFSTFGDRP